MPAAIKPSRKSHVRKDALPSKRCRDKIANTEGSIPSEGCLTKSTNCAACPQQARAGFTRFVSLTAADHGSSQQSLTTIEHNPFPHLNSLINLGLDFPSTSLLETEDQSNCCKMSCAVPTTATRYSQSHAMGVGRAVTAVDSTARLAGKRIRNTPTEPTMTVTGRAVPSCTQSTAAALPWPLFELDWDKLAQDRMLQDTGAFAAQRRGPVQSTCAKTAAQTSTPASEPQPYMNSIDLLRSNTLESAAFQSDFIVGQYLGQDKDAQLANIWRAEQAAERPKDALEPFPVTTASKRSDGLTELPTASELYGDAALSAVCHGVDENAYEGFSIVNEDGSGRLAEMAWSNGQFDLVDIGISNAGRSDVQRTHHLHLPDHAHSSVSWSSPSPFLSSSLQDVNLVAAALLWSAQ